MMRSLTQTTRGQVFQAEGTASSRQDLVYLFSVNRKKAPVSRALVIWGKSGGRRDWEGSRDKMYETLETLLESWILC